MPASATSTSSAGKLSIPAACSTGTSPTSTALAASARMLIRRDPMRSMTGPPSAIANTSGVSSHTATMPVLAAEPVVTSTNQGIAMALMRVPAAETAVLASNAATARPVIVPPAGIR
jgi:hypothetical protein